MNKVYICIDLKSFYASVECVERGLNPLKTNLVVADSERTDKTICLAVSPSLKNYGIPGRARLYEVVQKVRQVNNDRRKKLYGRRFSSKSFDSDELAKNHNLEASFIVAKPRMSYYMKYSTNIYKIYLNYLAKEDIYVYSIDEVFCDITNYLKVYNMTPRQLITKMIKEVYDKTGITATGGIGTNMYLAKIAMDIEAKHSEPNEYGVRIAALDEMSYRKNLWHHKPLTDFWRVGKGIATRLEKIGIYTMGDIARCSLDNEDLLYKLFGVNAETLIDHAWGYEPVTMKDIKDYKPTTNSLSSGQVLHTPYDYMKAKLIVKEMVELLSLELVAKKYVTKELVLTIGYDVSNIKNVNYFDNYSGEIVTDHYGRKVPKPSHGTINLEFKTSSTKVLVDGFTKLYDKIVNRNLLIRRINIVANNLTSEDEKNHEVRQEQLTLFSDYKAQDEKNIKMKKMLEDERKMQDAILKIKNKYGKNAILRGMNLENGATTIDRNKQIGGHHE